MFPSIMSNETRFEESSAHGYSPCSGELRRIQISPLPSDDADDEKVIVYQSPTFRFADSAGRCFTAPPPASVSPTPPGGSVTPGPYQLLEGGRPVKAEVKLMVKTADVGKQAVEIRSIRQFVDLPPGGAHHQQQGPFSRIFQSGSPSPVSSSSSTPHLSPASSPSRTPQVPERKNRKTRGKLLVRHHDHQGSASKNLGKMMHHFG